MQAGILSRSQICPSCPQLIYQVGQFFKNRKRFIVLKLVTNLLFTLGQIFSIFVVLILLTAGGGEPEVSEARAPIESGAVIFLVWMTFLLNLAGKDWPETSGPRVCLRAISFPAATLLVGIVQGDLDDWGAVILVLIVSGVIGLMYTLIVEFNIKSLKELTNFEKIFLSST